MRRLWLALVVLSFAATLRAQEAPKAEVYGGYLFADLGLVSGGGRPNANGWNASVAVNPNRWFGLVTDFGGLYGLSSSITRTFIVPCPTPPCTQQVVETFDGKVHTFLFGPRFTLRREKFAPFVHVLLGGARLNLTTTLSLPLPGFVALPRKSSSSNLTFALALGGGVDYKFRDRWAWRVQTDYLQSGFFSRTLDSFRLSTGIVFRFGE
jgi:opacity protein-like surface antigen